MRNKRIFIGSSTESKELAERIKIMLEINYDYIKCDLWYEDFFLTGSYVFTDLITRSIAYDYAVLLGNGDDDVLRRSTQQKRVSPRDNIYIEYSLFSAVLSRRNVLFLLSNECTIASDLTGMTLDIYQDDDDALTKCAVWFDHRENGSLNFNTHDVELLPTVGLAIGYYMSFVDKVGSFLQSKMPVILSDEPEIEYSYKSASIEILVPDYYEETFNYYWSVFEKKHKCFKNLYDKSVNATINKYRILVDPEKLKQGELVIYDIPSTLVAAFETVDYIIGEFSLDNLSAKQRALDNFAVVLKGKAARNPRVNQYLRLSRLSLV